ncbi:MAG TPA: DUF3108 domain-containing protein [Burkholderiaceae bacterium]|nr:DUF3108 domain-containing protein [Burkholderiaceae bacterium]
MSLVTAVTPPLLSPGRAILLIAASLLLHALVISVLRDRLVAPQSEAEPPSRTIDAALIAEAPPAPPPPRRVAPRRAPRPKPPPPTPPSPEPLVTPDPTVVAAPADEPDRPAPGESEGSVQVTGIAPPPTPAPDPARVEPAPAAPTAPVRGVDLAADMSEQGGAIEALPISGSYVYKLRDSRYSALSGTTTIDWRLDTGTARYEARLRATVFGIPLADISSSGSVQRFGIAPERYVQKTGTRAPVATNLDWYQHIVTFSSRTFQRAVRDGIQDRLSFQFQLMAIGQRLPEVMREGATISMDVAGPGDVEPYNFLVVGTETIETGAGPIEALKLDRPRLTPAEARVEVWLAPSRSYLPVMLRFTDRNGNVTESRLESADENR